MGYERLALLEDENGEIHGVHRFSIVEETTAPFETTLREGGGATKPTLLEMVRTSTFPPEMLRTRKEVETIAVTPKPETPVGRLPPGSKLPPLGSSHSSGPPGVGVGPTTKVHPQDGEGAMVPTGS